MSEAVRTAISTAVQSVDGVSCSPYFRQTTKAGDAMVVLARMTRDANGFGFVNTWQVQVLLPQDLAAAEKYMESKLPALIAAVEQELVIQTITPQEAVLDNGIKLPCLVIEGNRESD